MWRPLIAVAVLFCLGILLLVLRERHIVGDWANVLSIALIAFACILMMVSGTIVTIRKFPKYKDATIELNLQRIVQFIIVIPLGYATGKLLSGPIAYEKEFAQGLLTASSVLMALTGALLGIARFSATKETPTELVVSRFKMSLILSLFSGLTSIFLILFWYAKATFGFLEWACYTFCFQLGFILIFLFFPKYYLK